MLGIQFALKASISGETMGYYEDEYALERFEEDIGEEIADKALEEWEHLAAATLGDTAPGYIASMQVENSGGKITLSLDNKTSEGKLANKQEFGSKAFDMKPGLLKGKDYTVIGITHGNPKNVGESNPLSKRIWEKAKRMHIGERFSDTSRRKRNSTTRYKHKSPLYDDMLRVGPKRSKAFGGSFVTFRAISRNSDPKSWWHPGFEPLGLIDKVKESVEREFSDIINKAKMKRM